MMPGKSSSNVFISHFHEDSGIADAVSQAVEALFENAVSVSYSSKHANGGVPTGADWFRWIGDQVSGSPVTIVLVTPKFVAHPAWLLWEAGAVYGAALADEDRDTRVRPLLYRVDPGTLPNPLRSANVQMISGESPKEMHQFLAELIDDMDALDRPQTLRAGTRLEGIVNAYVKQVKHQLDRPAAVPAQPALDPETLKKLVDLTITAMQAFQPSLKMNGRYFYADIRSGRAALVRDENVYFETVSMPEEFGLSEVDLERGADTIVICQAFLRRTPIYEALGPELMEQYPSELRNVISPVQGWVLACPVGARDAKPLGVICLYGERPPARNQSEERRLLTIAVRLSETFYRVISQRRA